MAEPRPSSETRFYRVGVCLLLVGLLAAAGVYFTASPDDQSGAIGYEVVNGKTYPVMPGDSKGDESQVERIGGKSAVWGVEFNLWFGSLWHGRRLAYTLFVLSAAGGLACFSLDHLVTRFHPPDQPGGGQQR
jgi:hypothetical protein